MAKVLYKSGMKSQTIVLQNGVIEGCNGRSILFDFRYNNSALPKPTLIFCHGFMGFKDWGPFNLLADYLCFNQINVLKFNFSHNGITPENFEDIIDTVSFSKNNLLFELDDLESVLNFILNDNKISGFTDKSNIILMGHSRGGSISIIKASEDLRIRKLITLGALNKFGFFFTDLEKANWKKTGVHTVMNSRTKKLLPMLVQYLDVIEKNKERLNIESAIKKLSIPCLIIHGRNDETVPTQMAIQLNDWQPNSVLKIINDANHTFGGRHPWLSDELPSALKYCADEIIQFVKS